MKTSIVTTNFTGGEFDPLLGGRTDLEKFNSATQLLQNWVVLKQGGITIRPPLAFRGEVKNHDQAIRIIPFVFSDTTAYLLEFGGSYVRVWRDGVYLGVEMVSPIADYHLEEVRYTHSEDTMILFHPLYPPQRILRYGDTSWQMGSAPIDPGPIGENGHRPVATFNVAALSGGGVGFSTSVPSLRPADVGRTIAIGSGLALIIGYINPSQGVLDIFSPFQSLTTTAGEWVIQGSPMATLTPSAAGTVGQPVALTLSMGGWRPEDFDRYVEVNGGVVHLELPDPVNPDTVFSGTVIVDIAATTPAAPDAWVLKGVIWNGSEGYPTCGTFHGQRLWAASTRRFPQSLWGSKLGLSYDFTPGTTDDAAVYKTVAGAQANPILHLVSAATLMILGVAAEYSGKGGVEKGITQTNMQIDWQSKWSTLGRVRPLAIGEQVLAVERTGSVLRAYSAKQVDGFQSTALSFFSEHLLESGIKSMTFEQRPVSIVWIVTNDGHLAAMTYSVEQNLVCFASGFTQGGVEWVESLPNGARDATYAVVRRTINGQTKRYIEVLDWGVTFGHHDSLVVAASGFPKMAWDAPHLDGCTVRVHGDDIYMGEHVVIGGQFTLPRAVSKVAFGLGFDAEAVLQPPILETREGNTQGGKASIHKVLVKLYKTVGLTINGDDILFRRFGEEVLDKAVEPFTGKKDVTEYGWGTGGSRNEDDEGGVTTSISQRQGNPCTILAVIRNCSFNAG